MQRSHLWCPSGSMLPTLQIGDRLIANKLSSTIHRGDIVVFRRAPGDNDPEYPVLVKRVIGLPGETVSSVGNTILILTGSRWRNRGYRN